MGVPAVRQNLKHPSNDQTIGAVSAEAVVFHEEDHDLPQDYICHQIQMMQHAIRGQNKRYHKETLRQLLKKKTVILVDDLIMTGDTMLASIRTIKNYNPVAIIVATPVVTPEGTRAIADEINSIIYMTIQPRPLGRVYQSFPEVSEDEVLEVLHESKLHTNPGAPK